MIRLVAAIDSKHGIAKKGTIPWDIPPDKQHFRQLTLSYGANVLMGRTTYEIMGNYLDDRHNFLATHSVIKQTSNVHQVSDLDKFVTSFKEDLWVIGGEQVYGATIKYADELYLTEIDHNFNCDQFFPDFKAFKILSSDGPYYHNGLNFKFNVYVKIV